MTSSSSGGVEKGRGSNPGAASSGSPEEAQMAMKHYTQDGFLGAVGKLRPSYKVFVPVREGDFHVFKELTDGDRPDFGYRKTRVSPKGLVFPQSERMLVYSTNEHEPDHHIMREAPKEFPAQVVVGIRPYDALAFKVMDVNFDTAEYADPWWIRRYAATTLVGICRADADGTMFATENHAGPYDERGLDVIVYDLGGGYVAKAITEKGKAVLAVMGGESPGPAELQAVEKLVAAAPQLPALATDRIRTQPVVPLFEAAFWDEIAAGCLNCGVCTFLCPTCWCFDIQDEVHKQQGDRIRNWDSCMFPLYTLHASGHNPRGLKTQRVRNRFMHKLKYYLDKYDRGVMCVGCGRCVEACPVNIDIREVAERMNGFVEQVGAS
jgi:sulfhydrogenase subunit beta (sulfur reductase)